MTDKKELKQEELEKVSGGKGVKFYDLKAIEAQWPHQLTKYETENYIGYEVLLTNQIYNRTDYEYVIGTLVKSYEKSNGCGQTQRTAGVQVTQCEGEEDRLGYGEFSLDHWRTFIKE